MHFNCIYSLIIQIQWDVNAGKCGICGDSWSANPRDYELPNGIYVKNVSPVNKEFSQGQTINISIMLTANHNVRNSLLFEPILYLP